MKELAVQQLVDKFKRYQVKYTGKFRNITSPNTPLGQANIRVFGEAVDLLSRCPKIDQDLYVEAQFWFAKKYVGPCSPSWLVSEKAISRYTKFLEGRDIDLTREKDPEFKDLVLDSVKGSILFMNKKMVEFGVSSYKEMLFLKDKDAVLPKSYTWIITRQITKPFLSALKSYPDYYYSLDTDVQRDVPSPGSLESLWTYIRINKKLRAFCVTILGAECSIT